MFSVPFPYPILSDFFKICVRLTFGVTGKPEWGAISGQLALASPTGRSGQCVLQAAAPLLCVKWMRQMESYLRDMAWRVVRLGDDQTEAEGVPSEGGRGYALLQRMPPFIVPKESFEL